MRTSAITSCLDTGSNHRTDLVMTTARVPPHALLTFALAASLALLPSASLAGTSPRTGGHVGGHALQRVPGYLGIEFHDLTDAQASALHLRRPYGVEVLLVDHDGPAGHVGIQPHDIITGMNGNMVTSGEALRRMIHDAGAGANVAFNVFRDGQNVVIKTRLADREEVERRAWQRVTAPDPPQAAPGPGESYFESRPVTHGPSFLESMLHGPFTGLILDGMQPQLGNYFGAPRGQGLLVQSVEPDSPAALAGVQVADIILRADGTPMHSSSDWTKHLRASKGKPISLSILRQRRELTLSLQPTSKRR